MSETIGQRLREAREKRHLSLEQVADLTRIRAHQLRALETDDYSLIPSAAQARGFLRNYAEFLKIDLGQALEEIQRSRPQPAADVSGPMEKVDILPDGPRAAQIPPEPAPVFADSRTPAARASWLARFRRPVRKGQSVEAEASESEPAEASAEPLTAAADAAPHQTVAPASEVPAPADAAAAETPPVVEEQVEAGDDAQRVAPTRALWSRLGALFRVRLGSKNDSPESASTGPDSNESADQERTAASIEKPEAIFAEIGGKLRKRRELLSLTLDEVERHIHVRAVFIKALEEGAFDRLPSAVQTRGMLANYSGFLDLDTETLLLRFADAIQAGHRLRYPEKPGSGKSPMRVSPNLPPLRSFIAGDLIFGVAMAVLLVTMAVWGLNRVFAAQAEKAALPTAPSISDVLATSQQPTLEQQVTLIPAADTPLAAGPEVIPPDSTVEVPAFDVTISVQVTITVIERTFLRVIVDGEEALNGRVLSGATYTYEASDSIEVLTGNAAALRITYNGRDLGLMGNFGEVANRIYTADGVVTPTPVAPATSTPNATATPSPTLSGTQVSPSPEAVGD